MSVGIFDTYSSREDSRENIEQYHVTEPAIEVSELNDDPSLENTDEEEKAVKIISPTSDQTNKLYKLRKSKLKRVRRPMPNTKEVLGNLIRTCNEQKILNQQGMLKVDQNLTEIRLHNENFDNVLDIFKELENEDEHMMEKMFEYKMRNKLQLDSETKKVTDEFKKGMLDPGKQKFQIITKLPKSK